MQARGRLLLVSILALTVLLFAVNTLLMRQEFDASLATVNDLLDNALPCTKELVEARSDLRRLRVEVEHALAAQGDLRKKLEARARESWAAVERHALAYHAFPVFPGEQPLQDSLGRSLGHVRDAVDVVLVARDGETAEHLRVVDLEPSIDAAFEALGKVAEFNIAEAHESADAIVRRHARAKTESVLLLGLFAAAIVLVGGVAQHHLARAERELAKRMAELDAFASRVAHDLRGPLSPVRMALALAAREESSRETVLAAAKTADRSIERMVALIDGLLQFARAAAKAEPGARASVEQVCREVVAGVAALKESEKAELSVEVEPALEVAASQGVLISIVGNLVRNALMYLGDSPRRTVIVRAARSDSTVVIEVADTGLGIAPDLASRLFKPFERGSDRPGGHGLGLATVKRLVEGHGGSISVRSAPGAGSTFRVELPAA